MDNQVEKALGVLEGKGYTFFAIKNGSPAYMKFIDRWWDEMKTPTTSDVLKYCNIKRKTLSNHLTKNDCVLQIISKGKGRGKENSFDKYSVEAFKRINNF